MQSQQPQQVDGQQQLLAQLSPQQQPQQVKIGNIQDGGAVLQTLQNVVAVDQTQQQQLLQPAQQVMTLAGGQQVAVRGQVPMVMAPQQMLQMPQQVQMVPVQVPVQQQNGQTVYQTMQMQVPVQPQPQMVTAMMPQVVQTAQGQQQVVMQQVQVQQQAVQPQFVHIVNQNGQLQQVQVLGGMPGQQVMQTAGANILPAGSIPVQIQQPAMTQTVIASSSGTTTTSVLTTTTSTASTSTSTTTGSSEAPLKPKEEPDSEPDSSDEEEEEGQEDQKMGVDKLAGTQQQKQVEAQMIPQVANAQQAQVLSVKTTNGQVIQVKLYFQTFEVVTTV